MASREFEFEYPDGPRMTRDLTEESLKPHMNRLDIKIRAVGADWVWYRLPAFQDGSWRIGIELGFQLGALRELKVFQESDPKTRSPSSFIHSWFESKGFQAGSYPWGEIWVGSDEESGLGVGVVRYHRESASSGRRSLTRRILDGVALFMMLALFCALLKVGTPVFNNSGWVNVLVFTPAGATGVAVLHGFLASWIEKRLQRRAIAKARKAD